MSKNQNASNASSNNELPTNSQQALTKDRVPAAPLAESYAVKKHKLTFRSLQMAQVNTKCLLLEDTSATCAPEHVRLMLQQYDKLKKKSTSSDNEHMQAEILFLLIYIVALESGFVTQSDYDKKSAQLSILSPTSCFHMKNVIKLAAERPAYTIDCENTIFRMHLRCIVTHNSTTEHSLLKSRLTALITGDLMVVTLSPDESAIDTKGFSVCLSIGRYVINTLPKDKSVYHRFRKLDELSLLLRDQLYGPMRTQHLTLLDSPIFPSLIGLPAELYDDIFKFLNVNQLNVLANVNKQLNYHSTHSKLRKRYK